MYKNLHHHIEQNMYFILVLQQALSWPLLGKNLWISRNIDLFFTVLNFIQWTHTCAFWVCLPLLNIMSVRLFIFLSIAVIHTFLLLHNFPWNKFNIIYVSLKTLSETSVNWIAVGLFLLPFVSLDFCTYFLVSCPCMVIFEREYLYEVSSQFDV